VPRVRALVVWVPEARVAAVARACTAVLDAPNEAEAGGAGRVGWFGVGSMHGVPGAGGPGCGGAAAG
jgi:hypothetical protein